MQPIQKEMEEFRRQLEKGAIQKAYRALFSFMTGLRTHLAQGYPDSAVSGLYQGYMDMTFFALVPPALREHGLKIAIVFNYDDFGFEAWLAGSNRKIQRRYWELFRDGHWPGYRVVSPATGVDAIIACDLARDFDFDARDALTQEIETATAAFIDAITSFLAEHQPGEQIRLQR